jgi:O-antigen ligase
MSIRITALYVFVAVLLVYAWKDWFKSLCGLILLMAVIEHEDMPKSIFGIQGLNMWNVLFLGIFLAWLASRRREGLTWDMPRHISVLLLMYLAVVLVGVLRAALDRSHIEVYPFQRLMSEELINTVKWVLPGVLLFDGCRTRRRLIMAVVCLLAMYFLIAVQVVRHIPANSVLSADVMDEARKHCEDIGYGACDTSTFLAGACWGILATVPLVRSKKYKALILAAAGMVAFGQALTGGRAGYLAWGATGLVLCFLKWRKYLILVPVIVVLLPIVFPGAVDRMLEGFGQTDAAGQNTIDDYSMTSGRMLVWPYVIDKIGKSPIFGYGRLAMQRTGMTSQLMSELGESFPHPHNIYLETLLDNGILGSLPIIIFWATVVLYSARLFRSSNRLCSAVGGLALSFTLAQLIAGIGSQHFYPEESTLGTWAGMFLAVRVNLERARAQEGTIIAEGTWDSHALQQQQAAMSAVSA